MNSSDSLRKQNKNVWTISVEHEHTQQQQRKKKLQKRNYSLGYIGVEYTNAISTQKKGIYDYRKVEYQKLNWFTIK